MNTTLAKKLGAMAKLDQTMRQKAMKTGLWDEKIDKKNTKLLKKMIDQFGWPTIPMVGKKASFFAWLIVQHADHDVQFQKDVLKLIKKIYSDKIEVDPKNIAFLTDRILVNEGKKQIFGTQFYYSKYGQLIPNPIGNKKKMNLLREKYGLPSFDEYLKSATIHSQRNKKE